MLFCMGGNFAMFPAQVGSRRISRRGLAARLSRVRLGAISARDLPPPAQTLRAFGANGASVYSFMFTAFGSAALLGPILGARLFARGGFELVFRVLGLLSFVSTGLTALL